ncbi:hypothetical protein BN1058_01654 [Paraliobacillus sp. PM-2]|uniref:hypothetical protein n=1 Tax=Paraliobacillus sp. PM-2 TaxID=1462524 RepID=UPI00061BF724|nr:hypothetical protein [Paraliobacillus sp. PM-2]CQR47345.1 hypothetical protein BN1058_01654 [Paraliobacillus sp. PM-2]
MMNAISLKILDKFSRLFHLLGINYITMRQILAIKLTMDQRRVPTIFQDVKQKENSNAFLKSLLLYALYGLVLIPFLIMGDNYLFQMSIVFGMVMFILMTSMIADFSTVLLDVRDKAILNTKPVDQKTISAAKMIHVVIYMTQLTGAFILIPLAVSLFVKGITFSLLLLVEIIFVALFIIVLTALIYMLILRYFDGERLKDLINYVQIFLSVSIIVGYQFIAHSFQFVDYVVSFDWQWWHVLIPPIWFAAPFEWLLLGNQEWYIMLFTALAALIPIGSIFVYIKFIPSFERNLQKMMQTSGSTKIRKHRWEQTMAKLICRTNHEKTLFQFAYKMISQEREFKLKVYPSLGFSIIMPFILLFNVIQTDSNAPYAYLAIYFCNLMIPNVIHMLKFSSKYKGSWIYGVLPIANRKSIYRATLKAFIVKLYLPIILLICTIFLTIFSDISLLPDMIAIILVGIWYIVICYRLINNQHYPFSQPFSFAQNTNTAMMIVTMFVIGGFAFVHFLVSLTSFGVYFYIIVLFISNWISWKKVFS